MFHDRLSDMLLNTLQVMNRHGRLALLQPLLRAYDLRREQARGEVEVTATSAVELDAAQRAEVARVAAALSGKKPVGRLPGRSERDRRPGLAGRRPPV